MLLYTARAEVVTEKPVAGSACIEETGFEAVLIDKAGYVVVNLLIPGKTDRLSVQQLVNSIRTDRQIISVCP